MKKKILSFLVAGTLVAGTAVGIAGCGGGKSDKLMVWGPTNQQEVLKELIQEFKTANPDIKIGIETGTVSEADAYSKLSNDVEEGADVFAFANDQLMNLKQIGGLSALGTKSTETIIADNDAGSVEAGKIGNKYYGYPYSSDNGYFMYYDKSIISAEDATSLDKVLQRCKENDKYFIFELTNSWYVGSFLYGAGASYEVTYSEAGIATEIQTNMDAKPEGSELTYGEIGGKALLALNSHKYFIKGDDNTIDTYLDEGDFGACIRGTWKSAKIAEALGENYAATRCPDFTVDGKDYPMVAFSGYKLYGVNGYTKHPEEAHKLAAFLSSKSSQEKRYAKSGIGPSNKEVAASEAVQKDVALAALAYQVSDTKHFKVQGSLPGTYWTAMETFGQDIYNKVTSASNLKAQVELLQTNLSKLTVTS